MPVTLEQARDAINQVLKDAIEADMNYDDTLILWDDTNGDPPADVTTPYIRFTVRHASGSQTTLTGGNGTRRFTQRGIATAQVFTAIGDGHSTSDAIAAIIMTGYRNAGGGNGVWYRNVRAVEQGVSGGYTQVNVYTEFLYDEVL